MHRHHIVPLHMGGPKDGPTVLLTIEQHAEAHRELWELYGKWEDLVAWQCLSGAMPHQDAIKIAISEGGRRGGVNSRGVKRSEAGCRKMSESAKRKSLEWLRDPEMRKLVGLKNVGSKRSAGTRERIRLGAIERHRREKENGRAPRSQESRERSRLGQLRRKQNS